MWTSWERERQRAIWINYSRNAKESVSKRDPATPYIAQNIYLFNFIYFYWFLFSIIATVCAVFVSIVFRAQCCVVRNFIWNGNDSHPKSVSKMIQNIYWIDLTFFRLFRDCVPYGFSYGNENELLFNITLFNSKKKTKESLNCRFKKRKIKWNM